MENIRQFAVNFVTDLVNRSILAKEINGKWVLQAPILGYSGDVTFHSKEELIQKLVAGAMSQYATTLKATG